MVLAPEHPLVARLTSPEKKAEVEAYIMKSRHQSEIERLSTEKEKDGVFIGAYCVNRLNGQKVPIWIADYVLLSYGTGAVMAVPAHDERDFAFAKKYHLPIPVVIAPPDWDGKKLKAAYIEPGTMVNSGQFNGLPGLQGIDAVSKYLEEKGWGRRAVSYKIRDWLISRQRYWGAPIPIIYCKKCGTVPVPEKDLPVLLPEDAEFKPTGESPLKYHKKFVNTTCPRCGGPAERETDTMDSFVCSSWYFLRYASPRYAKAAFDPAKVKHWLPVDFYTGGAEHAVMHLLYARFFIKAIRDIGIVDFDEPFLKLFNQGIILSGQRKMSKSRGNVVNPDDYVASLGADTLRGYFMFLGPWDQGGEWDDSGISGMSRWMRRIWTLVLDGYKSAGSRSDLELARFTHRTIKKVTEDIEKIRFNTMVAALMEFTNYLGKVREDGSVAKPAWDLAVKTLLLLLAPSAPHLSEELWQRAGYDYSIHNQPWPQWHEDLVKEEEIVVPVQVNGKLRDTITMPAAMTVSVKDAELPQIVKDRSKRVSDYLEGRSIVKIIHVRGKIINFIIR
jgi:leucyl-tRNA synthetase